MITKDELEKLLHKYEEKIASLTAKQCAQLAEIPPYAQLHKKTTTTERATKTDNNRTEEIIALHNRSTEKLKEYKTVIDELERNQDNDTITARYKTGLDTSVQSIQGEWENLRTIMTQFIDTSDDVKMATPCNLKILKSAYHLSLDLSNFSQKHGTMDRHINKMTKKSDEKPTGNRSMAATLFEPSNIAAKPKGNQSVLSMLKETIRGFVLDPKKTKKPDEKTQKPDENKEPKPTI